MATDKIEREKSVPEERPDLGDMTPNEREYMLKFRALDEKDRRDIEDATDQFLMPDQQVPSPPDDVFTEGDVNLEAVEAAIGCVNAEHLGANVQLVRVLDWLIRCVEAGTDLDHLLSRVRIDKVKPTQGRHFGINAESLYGSVESALMRMRGESCDSLWSLRDWTLSNLRRLEEDDTQPAKKSYLIETLKMIFTEPLTEKRCAAIMDDVTKGIETALSNDEFNVDGEGGDTAETFIGAMLYVASSWSAEQWVQHIAQAQAAIDADYERDGEKFYRIPVLVEGEVS